ncbi:MAG: hypothetical protein GY904_01090, partial [Planctomycetaceae bacterium]|nr:hypothetical protein [Planctomycetaceae bacterium]
MTRINMDYARSRLILGMVTVGTIVVLSVLVLSTGCFGISVERFGRADLQQVWLIPTALAAFFLLLVPFDFLGGFVLPKRFARSQQTFADWSKRYLPGVIQQWLVYSIVATLLAVLAASYGVAMAVVFTALVMLVMVVIRDLGMSHQQVDELKNSPTLQKAIRSVEGWGISVNRISIADHRDSGFTGGIVGFGKWSTIVIPRRWLAFEAERLATAIARRALAIQSGSYTIGIVASSGFNLVGFALSMAAGSGEVGSLIWLLTSMCWFTIWSFAGLLLLPTISRNASLKIDRRLASQGVSKRLIIASANELDQLQDGEPSRTAIIEAVFHPIPSVEK